MPRGMAVKTVLHTGEEIRDLKNVKEALKGTRLASPKYWTKSRVLAALRQAAADFWDNDPEKLPASTGRYTEMIQTVYGSSTGSGAGRGKRRTYPGTTVILRYWPSMNRAWYELGFIVETKVSRVSAPLLEKHPELMDRLRKVYERDQRTKPGPNDMTVRKLADEYGVGHHILCQIAAASGFVTPKEAPWSRAEYQLLEKYGHLSPVIIQKHFVAAGFPRTVVAIRLMRKRRNAHKGSPYYSGTALTKLMGIDGHTIDRNWLIKFPDELPFEMKGTTRHGHQRGDIRLFHVDTIRKFFWNHPEEVDLRKVDPLWFQWLISNGKTRMAAAPKDRISKRAEAYMPEMTRDHKRPGRKPKAETLSGD
jgi:hypothetical protein